MDKVAYFLTVCMSLLALSCGDGHKVDSSTELVLRTLALLSGTAFSTFIK